MSKPKKSTIEVQGTAITILAGQRDDFISLTDIARYKDSERTDYLILNWMRIATPLNSLAYGSG